MLYRIYSIFYSYKSSSRNNLTYYFLATDAKIIKHFKIHLKETNFTKIMVLKSFKSLKVERGNNVGVNCAIEWREKNFYFFLYFLFRARKTGLFFVVLSLYQNYNFYSFYINFIF